MKVLLAEDDFVSRRILEVSLDGWGYEVISVEDGLQAWEALQAPSPPSIVILDWMMPKLDGLEVIKMIRSWERPGKASTTYVILLTTKNSKQDVVEGLESGANDYITKPYDMDELNARIRVGSQVVELQERFYKAFTINPTPMLLNRLSDGAVIEVNDSFLFLFEKNREDIVGNSFETIGIFQSERCKTLVEELTDKGTIQNVEFRFVTEQGREINGIWSAETMTIGEVPYMISVVNDLTERKRFEQKLKSSELLLQGILNAIPDRMWVLNEKKQIQFCNKVTRDMFGDDIIGQPCSRVNPKCNLEKCLIDNTLQTGEIHQDFLTFTDEDGEERHYWASSSPVVRDEVGKTQLIVEVLRDVTELKKIEDERQRFKERLREAKRVESMAHMAASIAHDFNNLMTGIIGNIDLILLDMPASSAENQVLLDIEYAAKRAAQLSRQMLAFSGKEHLVKKDLECNQWLEDHLSIFTQGTPDNIEVQSRFSSKPLFIEGDSKQLLQMFENLHRNAVEAIEKDHGIIEFSTELVECRSRFLANTLFQENAKPGLYAMISVRDNGQGINEAIQDKVFDPFFSTKQTGRGLGLAAVFGTIRSHQGTLRLESQVGKGTTVEVYLPIHDSASGSSEWSQGSLLLPRDEPKATVLVVDDETIVLRVVKKSLERFGYRVYPASSGLEALELYSAKKDQISLVILDLTMPHMGGEETLDELKKIDPHVLVLLASGYAENDLTNLFEGKGAAGFLQKPFQAKQLIAKIEEILDSYK